MEIGIVTELGMGMGRNGNGLHGNVKKCECKKPVLHISTCYQVWTRMHIDIVVVVRFFTPLGRCNGVTLEAVDNVESMLYLSMIGS